MSSSGCWHYCLLFLTLFSPTAVETPTFAIMFLPQECSSPGVGIALPLGCCGFCFYWYSLLKPKAFIAVTGPKGPKCKHQGRRDFVHLVHRCVSALRKAPQMLLVTEPGWRLCGCYGAISLALLFEMLHKLVRGMFPYYIFTANATEQAKWGLEGPSQCLLGVVRSAWPRGPPRSYQLGLWGRAGI